MAKHLFLPIFVILMITSTFGENLESNIDDYAPLNPLEETRGATKLSVRGNYVAWYHNQYRVEAAKSYRASNMKVMHWDSNLARQAQNYANKCIYKHSKMAGVGENLYMSWTNSGNEDPKSLEKKAVDSWADEKNLPQSSFNPFVFNYNTGHWTAMIWANTNRVGCGLVRCPSVGKYSYKYKYSYIMVCQYSPAGNMRGASAFKRGKPCSKCENGCANNYLGGVLCH